MSGSHRDDTAGLNTFGKFAQSSSAEKKPYYEIPFKDLMNKNNSDEEALRVLRDFGTSTSDVAPLAINISLKSEKPAWTKLCIILQALSDYRNGKNQNKNVYLEIPKGIDGNQTLKELLTELIDQSAKKQENHLKGSKVLKELVKFYYLSSVVGPDLAKLAEHYSKDLKDRTKDNVKDLVHSITRRK